MFIKRALSGFVLVVLAVILLWKGGVFLLAALWIISLIGTYELLRAIEFEKRHIGIVSYLTVTSFYGLLYLDRIDAAMFLLISALLIFLGLYVISYPKYKIENIAMVFFVIFYVGILMSYVYQVRCLKDGEILVWLIFICAWGSDTFAYLTGMLIGKHKLPSELSPKKTIEGSIGGVVGAALLGFAFSFAYVNHGVLMISPQILFPLLAACGSVISQFGDLAASAIKRNHNVKDYGDLIPGHGGILDRFDSIIFVAPVVYYFLVSLSQMHI